MFARAIVRPPSLNFAAGLTTANLGEPVYETARSQHHVYCEALERCGLTLTRLDPDAAYPDSTFVEDTAVLTATCAIITRPGAPSRAEEIVSVAGAVSNFYQQVAYIQSPGAIDGGDVCRIEDRFLIGISERTNEAGARQLAGFLHTAGYDSEFVDIRDMPGLLHLKSGLAYLGDRRLVAVKALADHSLLREFDVITVPPGEEPAANCIRINAHVLIAAGCHRFQSILEELGYHTIALEMSEFQKMDGGLSCLSLRF